MKTLFLPLLTLSFFAQSIPTANGDLNRTNQTITETVLTPTSVTAGRFHLLGNYPVDGFVFAQPLYVPGIMVSGVSHNLLIVVTLNNSVYAFDATNGVSATPLWSNLTFATPYTGYPTNPDSPLYSGGLGCLSTPVADATNNRLYVVCDSVVGSTPNWILRKLDLTSGSTLQSVTIAGQVVGTGDTGATGGSSPPGPVADTTSGANLLFFPQYQFQRAGLALSADLSTVYIGFGSMDDTRPYHGWLMAYATSSLTQSAIWCATPNSWGGAVWGASGAPAIDGSGNVYVTTGNGFRGSDVTAITDGVVRFTSSLGSPTVWLAPDEVADDSVDADQASNRFLLIPGTGLGVAAGKDFNVYVITLASMTLSQSPFATNGLGTPSSSSGSYGVAFMGTTLYLPITSGGIYGFSISGGVFNSTPSVTQSNTYGFPGPAQIFGSSNAGSTPILWVVTVPSSAFSSKKAGTLRALNPATLTEYWNSGTSGIDTLGSMAKYTAPIVASGRVFVPTQDNKVQVFGIAPLLPGQLRGKAQCRGKCGIN
jgi:hypothetical protein